MLDATIYHGTLPLLLNGPIRSRGERGALDSASWEALTAEGAEDAQATDLGFSYDKPIDGFYSMWVQSIDDEPESDLATRLTIRAIGLLKEGEKRRRKIAVGSKEVSVGPFEKVILSWVEDEQGIDPVTSEPVEKVLRRTPALDTDGKQDYLLVGMQDGTQEKWNIKESVIIVRDTYYTTTRPDTSLIGTAIDPPNPPEVPFFRWAGYDFDLRYNTPSGWVLDDRQVDELFVSETDPDTGLWQVEDITGYYYTSQPE